MGEQLRTRSVRHVFDQPGEFVACRAAEKWCEENGYSVGRMQWPSPRGLLRGSFDIQKWRNLSPRERAELDGQMTGDMRNGPVYVTINASTERPREKVSA